MTERLSRRGFLKTTGIFVAGGAATAVGAESFLYAQDKIRRYDRTFK